MISFNSLARARFSVRKFESRPIAEEAVQYILEAAQLAPTACNFQALHIYALASAEARAKLSEQTKYTFAAPLIFCLCAETDRTWKNPLETGVTSAEQDCAIVATHMMLAAWEQGVGSCCVGYFAPTKLAEALSLPVNHRPVLLIPMGYPAQDAQPSASHEKTRSLAELVTKL